MVISSNQISQLIGGQQTAYSNQQAFSHQVGMSAGIAMPPGAHAGGFHSPSFGVPGYGGQQLGVGGMPFPTGANTSPGGYGAAAVGGLGAAIPAGAAGVSMAAGLGLAPSVLDPFTTVGRSFMGGYGAAGGMGGAGLGAVGAGLRAAALPALGYYAAYQAINTVGQNIYAGAQNISQVGGMAQNYFGPSYGEMGARPGGQMSRGQISAITGVLGEMASSEVMADMSEMKRIMDRAGQFGMLTGIQNVGQFKQKFKEVFSQAKDIAQVLGSSIEDAVPVLNQFQRMGMWSANDIMGGAIAMKTVGSAAAPQLLQSMQMGAARSHAMGGSLAAGAALGRNQFMNVQAAVREGVLPQEMIQEITGGVGGVEGQRMVADRLTAAVQQVSQTPMGRLAMAGLGETRDGRFTGRVDQEKLKAFQSGQLTISDLQRMGSRVSRTREGAASFTYRQEQIGQELMSQGGLDFVGAGFQAALDRAGFGAASEDIQGLMLQKMYGLGRRDAQMIQKLLKEMPAIQERRQRRELSAIEDAFRQVEEKQNRSMSGFMDAARGAFEESIERPIQEFGERLATSWNESFDSLTDAIWGRRRQLQISRQERMRMLYQGGTRGVTNENIQSLMSGDIAATFGSTSAAERIRSRGVGFFEGVGASVLSGLGLESGLGTRASTLSAQGAGAVFRGEAGPGDIPLYSAGGGQMAVIPRDSAQAALEGIRRRGGFLEASQVFGGGSRDNLERVKRAYSTVLTSPSNREKLRKMRDSMTPAQYSQALVSMVRRESPEAAQALDSLARSRGDGARGLISDLDAIAVIQKESGWQANNLEADFGAIAKDLGPTMATLFQDSEELSKFAQAGVQEAFQALESRKFSNSGVGNFGASMQSRDLGGLSQTQLYNIMAEGGRVGEELSQWAASGDSSVDPSKYPTLYAAAMGKGGQYDPRIDKIVGIVGGQMSASERQQFAKGAQQVQLAKRVKVSAGQIEQFGSMAAEELTKLGAGGPSGLRGVLGEFVRAGADRDVDRFRSAQAQARDLAGSLDQSAVAKLRKLGGPVAEHVADLAEINRLDIRGMSGQQVRRRLRQSGLMDEFALLKASDPEKYQEFEKMLEGGNITTTGSRRFREALRKVEERVGVTESTTARERAQDQMTTQMTKFLGANEKFVLAVSEAVPKLADVTVDDLRKQISEVSQNQATRGVGR